MSSPNSNNDRFFQNVTFGSAIVVIFVLFADPQTWIGDITSPAGFFAYLIFFVGPALLAVFVSLTFVNFEPRIWLLMPIGLWFLFLSLTGRARGDLKLLSGIIIILAGMWFVIAPIWRHTTQRLP
jgi:hypothetical protein